MLARTAPYGTATDDDGTGTVGTVINNTWLQGLLDLIDARWSRVTITSTGSQNNLSISDADLVIFNNATDLTITGMLAPSSPTKPGKPVRYVCVGAGNVYFRHQNTNSTAANRIINIATSGDTPHAGGSGVGALVYDDANSRWRLIQHEQGAPIEYSATSTIGGWTSFTTKKLFYMLIGKLLFVGFQLEGTSNATTGTFTLPFNRFTAAGYGWTFPLSGDIQDNGAVITTDAYGAMASAGATVTLTKDRSGTAWTGSGGKRAAGSFSVPVD